MSKDTATGIVYRTFDGDDRSQHFSALCGELLAQQRGSWPELGRAYESLRDVRSREISCSGFSVRLVFNPGRAVNTTAAVSPHDVLQRPCFLCPSSLPAQQKGILYRGEYLVLGNPRPAVPSHLTIAHLRHNPQAILEHIDKFLQIGTDLGSDWTVLYNGPRCGASAPDHLHFQAVPSGQMPIEKEIGDRATAVPVNCGNRARLYRADGLGRNVIIIEGDDVNAVGDAFREHLGAVKQESSREEEPMMNVAGSFSGAAWRLIIFPRRAHRPAAFFKEGEERIVVSPAVMEMAGIFVTPVERDFNRLDAATIESIFREVSLMDN